jgi:hypothetical protein
MLKRKRDSTTVSPPLNVTATIAIDGEMNKSDDMETAAGDSSEPPDTYTEIGISIYVYIHSFRSMMKISMMSRHLIVSLMLLIVWT